MPTFHSDSIHVCPLGMKEAYFNAFRDIVSRSRHANYFSFTFGVFSRVHMHNLHQGANLLPGANLHPRENLHHLASRSYANKLCPYAPKFDLKFKTRYSVLRRNSLRLNVRSDSSSEPSVCKCLPQYFYCECALKGLRTKLGKHNVMF